MKAYSFSPHIEIKTPKVVYNGYAYPDYRLTVGDLPPEERPREKLIAQGPEALSTQELAVLLLVTGTTKENVIDMSNRLIKDYGEKNIFEERDAKRLAEELDIPLSKACQIVAVGEIGRRIYDRTAASSHTIRNAKDVYEYVADMRTLPKEHLRALYVNSRGRILRDQVISMGSANMSIISPREVFNPAIDLMAVAVILVHNHPSGELVPSDEDVTMTERLVQAGKILGIRVLDHIIVAKDGFASIQVTY